MAYDEDPRELLPRFKIDYIYKTKLGDIKIKITTAGENYRLQIQISGNLMKAQMIKAELEKQLTYIALVS
jgi:ribosomal protein L18